MSDILLRIFDLSFRIESRLLFDKLSYQFAKGCYIGRASKPVRNVNVFQRG